MPLKIAGSASARLLEKYESWVKAVTGGHPEG
jgi:hypothetical protein